MVLYMYKLISELSIRELKTVFVRTGRRGVFLESSAIIQLTIFLVRIGQDPFTYRFPVSVQEDSDPNATVVKKAEVSNFPVQYAKDTVKNVPEFECSSHSSVIADSVSATVEGTESGDIETMENEENLFKDQEKSRFEEVVASSPPEIADGFATDSGPSSESWDVSSSVLLSSSSEIEASSQPLFESLSKVSCKPFLVRHSDKSSKTSVWMVVSNRSIKCLCIVETLEVKPLYSDHWPPDINLVFG